MTLGRREMPHTVESGLHNAHVPECTRVVCSVENRSDLLDLDRIFYFLCCTSRVSYYYFVPDYRSDLWVGAIAGMYA